MKDKKREEMPDILNDILGSKPETRVENKSDIKPLERHDIVTSQHHDENNAVKQPVQIEENKPTDTATLQRHDAIIPKEPNQNVAKPKIYRTTLYLPEELYIKLDEAWLKERKNGLSKNEIIVNAINDYLVRA